MPCPRRGGASPAESLAAPFSLRRRSRCCIVLSHRNPSLLLLAFILPVSSKHLHNNDRLIKHLNEKVIEKINEDEVWRRRVQPELRARLREPMVLLCYDGFGKGTERNARWTTQFLKDLLGQSTDVRTFSFRVLDTERNCRMMQFCDFFFSLVAMRRT